MAVYFRVNDCIYLSKPFRVTEDMRGEAFLIQTVSRVKFLAEQGNQLFPDNGRCGCQELAFRIGDVHGNARQLQQGGYH